MTSPINWICALGACITLSAHAAPVQCIAPAKPGGGMAVTCKLIQQGLQTQEPTAAKISYLPGGIGAVAWNSIVTQRRAEADTLVAFSGGSLMNLAQGKYGRADVNDVRWVAAVGVDYGMVAVRNDSPYKTLRELMEALRKNPANVTIGAAGTVGSQDWLKISMLAKYSKIDPKTLRFVALEGGGEAFTALRAGHVQLVSGDASEATLHAVDGEIRVLAVLSDKRLPGTLANVPTAREQGIDISWPVVRGVYMGPQVSDDDYQRWVRTFDKMMASQEFNHLRAANGLYPMTMSGDQLTKYIRKTVEDYRKQSDQLGLIR
ncbi:tripartite tricarboxylate transporter receptor family protein [Collimonas arenae]|uniref:Tripartite tricarboxylate transporter receptor family protein n=1 Tax=Collimonas arenae TaxID=279058 RepID=A0A127PXB0_9BURK|nr:tripartite tricarboxylate transporter substrate-binding protein [Collimonas arenae]AMP02379.1 tripartite tricarboxylate transporter receptor family protein [Collimonas arenae]AMP12274.1 tripartite tricarboxylate transporter receptor family protein [Collimonas arenae]